MTTPVDYEELVTAATMGVDRHPLPVEHLAGPAAAHAAVVDVSDPAAALLDAAALLTAARRAGTSPGPAGLASPATNAPLTAAPPDHARELSRVAAEILRFTLHGSDPELAADLLTLAAGAGFRAPAPLLPALLDAASRDRSLRAPVAAVLGERGRWLAAFRPDWQRVADAATADALAGRAGTVAAGTAAGVTVAGTTVRAGAGAGAGAVAGEGGALAGPDSAFGDRATWELGRPSERRAWLAALRQADPAAARELLAAGWSRESGDERADLIGVLAAGLTPADEPFLEAALDDRKAAVRQTAARLLTRLPASGYAQRAVARAAPLLAVERRGLLRRLIVTLPGPLDPAARRDGIRPEPPSPAIGERAWLLTQLIAAMPLAEWTTRLGLAPAELAMLPAPSFGADVHAGWRLAAVAQRDVAWAAALLAAEETADEPRDRRHPPAGPPMRPPATQQPATQQPAARQPPTQQPPTQQPPTQQPAARPPAAWPPAADLAALLPAGAQLARAEALLEARGLSHESVTALASCAGPWLPSTARAVLGHFAAAARAGRAPRATHLLFPVSARKLPATGPVDYAAALCALADSGAADDALATGLTRVAAIVARRHRFHQELER